VSEGVTFYQETPLEVDAACYAGARHHMEISLGGIHTQAIV